MLEVTMVGCGAIGHGIIGELDGDANVRVTQIIVPETQVHNVTLEFPGVAVGTSISELPIRPELLLECAGHGAITGHVLPALAAGIDCIMCSTGALSEPGLPERLQETASSSQSRVQLVSGAIGGIDAIAAASVGGLERVIYTGRKPPFGWKGTPAEDTLDLQTQAEAATFFVGSAREAARVFPKNANVAATVSFAGLGLERTEVHLIADPMVSRNVHRVKAVGAFGELELQLSGFPLESNPKTSALTVYSAVRALRNRSNSLII